jgi:uncharacterized protein YfaS (alpha-2-macroglobulin family)
MAIDLYNKKVEKGATGQVRLTLPEDHRTKKFEGIEDRLLLEKDISHIKEPFDIHVTSPNRIYLTTELNYSLEPTAAKDRGIYVQRMIYNKKGEKVSSLQRGEIYQVEILLDARKEVPYGVIDEPIPAGTEILREDIITTRKTKEYNTQKASSYKRPWIRKEVAHDRMIVYTYRLKGKHRVVYFVKALYTGTFTWLPTEVQGMYHPQYFGRNAVQKIIVK